MVTKPVIFTEIKDVELSLERPTQEEVVRKFFQNLNMLAELAKIGSIDAIALNQPGAASPDVSVLQLADGSEITNVNSPLRTTGITNRYTPSMVNRYLRGANAGTTSGNEAGGSATVNLEHSHGGVTGAVSFALTANDGTEQSNLPNPHAHGIFNDLNPLEPLNPSFQQIAFYLKIN